MKKRKFGDHPGLKMVNANAAAIDIGEPLLVCRRLQLLSRMEHHKQDDEQIFLRSA